MTDAIEVALISDNNDQLNSVAVWDIRNGTMLMQYRGKSNSIYFLENFISNNIFRRRSGRKAHAGSNQQQFYRDGKHS